MNMIYGKPVRRVNFFVTKDIDRFLKRIAKKKKVPMSVYLRLLIEQDMENYK